MNIDPVALAQLPFAAFLILLGLSIAWSGAKSVWVWGRELTEVRTDRDYWKQLAIKAAETNAKYADHVEQLTSVMESLVAARADRP